MSSNEKAQGFKNLLVWQKGMGLAKRVYEITQQLPPEEKFGLVTQMRRAAVSIPSNIAEAKPDVRRVNSFSFCPMPKAHWLRLTRN